MFIHVEGGEADPGNGHVDVPVPFDLGEVAHPAQEQVGDTGGATATAGNLVGRTVVDGHPQNTCRALDDAGEGLGIVVFEPEVDAKTRAERGGEQARAGGGANQGKGVEGDLNATGVGTRLDHDVDAVVFHGRVKVLFHHGAEAVNLIDKKHVVGFEAGEKPREVARLVEYRPRSHLHVDTQLMGDDVRERGLAQARGAMKEGVVEGLAPLRRGLHEHPEVLHDLLLPGEAAESVGAQNVLQVFLRLGEVGTGGIEVAVHVFLYSATKITKKVVI